MEKRTCPNCGSDNVEPDRRHTNVLGEAVFNQNKWLCNECGYTGIMPEGSPEDLEKDAEHSIEFEPEDQEQVDRDTGQALFKYFLYISVPLLSIFILSSLI